MYKSFPVLATIISLCGATSFAAPLVERGNENAVALTTETFNVPHAPNTAQAYATLTVKKTGSGKVTSNPAGVDCGSACSARFSGKVTLTATPAIGYTFSKWTGSCSGTNTTCTLNVAAAKTVGAVFTAAKNKLRVTTTGSGTVTSSPSGISCGYTCSASLSGAVTLTAAPASGYYFAGWSGACAGNSTTCTVVVDSARSVAANFEPIAADHSAYNGMWIAIVNECGAAGIIIDNNGERYIGLIIDQCSGDQSEIYGTLDWASGIGTSRSSKRFSFYISGKALVFDVPNAGILEFYRTEDY